MAHLVPAAGRTVCLPKARSLLLRLSPVHGNRPSSFSSPFPYSLPSRFASFPTLIPFSFFSLSSPPSSTTLVLSSSPSPRDLAHPFHSIRRLHFQDPTRSLHSRRGSTCLSRIASISFEEAYLSPIYFSLPFLLPLRSPSRRIRAGSFTLPPAANINPGRS
jgi:hypothetical protein